MEFTKKEINQIEKDHELIAENYKFLQEYDVRLVDDYLKVQLGVLAFIGLIVATIFSNRDSFSRIFFICFCFLLLLFILFILKSFWYRYTDMEGAIFDIGKKASLANIRRTVIKKVEKKEGDEGKYNLSNYYSEYFLQAQKMLADGHEISKQIDNGVSVDDIIKMKKTPWRKGLIVDSFVFLLIPILFLLEEFDLWKIYKNEYFNECLSLLVSVASLLISTKILLLVLKRRK